MNMLKIPAQQYTAQRRIGVKFDFAHYAYNSNNNNNTTGTGRGGGGFFFVFVACVLRFARRWHYHNSNVISLCTWGATVIVAEEIRETGDL